MDLRIVKNILKFVSLVLVALSLFLYSAILVGLIYHERVESLFYIVTSLFTISLLTLFLLRDYRVSMSIKGGILSVNIIWILLGVIGAIPLVLYTHVSFVDAFFEAISGFTTTGATIYSDIESLPKIVLYLRSLMHWLGGMGIIVLSVGLFSLLNPTGSMALFKAESTGVKVDKITPKIKDTALKLWGVYILFTLIDAMLLKLAGMSYFDAINHAFSTISTGGFSTKNSSLGYFDSNLIYWITTTFMILSAINFLAHLKLFSKGSFEFYKKEEVVWFLTIFLVLSIALSLIEIIKNNDTISHAITHSFFTISSIITTTGFATLDYEKWGHLAVATIFIAMFIGGNSGSTAGGVKVIRYIVMFKNLFLQFKKMLHPNMIADIFIDKSKVSLNVTLSTMGFLFLYFLTIIGIMLYLFGRDYDMLTSISTALATVGNIGPGFALSGPAQNYAFFSSLDKVVLSFAMIIGRLEFYTVLILFSKSFWKKF